MSSKTIVVKISNAGVGLTHEICVNLANTNLPHKHLSFRTHDEIFWDLEMLSYSADDKILKVRVLDYGAKSIADFSVRKPKSEIRSILFEELDWNQLEPLLSSYQKINLSEAIDHLDNDPFSSMSDDSGIIDLQDSDNILVLQSNNPEIVTEIFDVQFSDARIGLGYISFSHFFQDTLENVDIKIANTYLLPEFELIKFWFAKKLKTKKFKVSARFTIANDKVVSSEASLKEIYNINEKLIESIKFQRVMGLTKKPFVTAIDKSLFTSEDIFDMFDKDVDLGNVFAESEEEILKLLIEHSRIRNKQQLSYLSGKKQSLEQKLRFTLHPHFGFLFLVEGNENNHFIWELLDSNATYIWSFLKNELDIELQYRRIEETINIVRANGRDSYKRAYTKRQVDADMVFKVIAHEDIGSNLKDHFPKWKNRLEEQLV